MNYQPLLQYEAAAFLIAQLTLSVEMLCSMTIYDLWG